MFRFEDSTYLYLLVLIPLFFLIRLATLRQRKKRLKSFGKTTLVRNMMPDVSSFRRTLKFWILMSALALTIVMLARPQMGTKISQDERSGIEVIVAMDISNSMLAEDVLPSRLDRSKMLLENMVEHFSDDKVGLVVFAGDAFVQLPITSDYVSAKMFLQNITPSLITTQGTDIAGAISVSMKSFTQQKDIGRAIVLITDGEDHEGGAIEAAKDAKKNGMHVFVLGVGSSKGSPIPDGNGGYLKDNTGNEVMSGLNEDMCRQIASSGGGAYIHVDNSNSAQKKLDSELARLQKGDLETVVYNEYAEQFQAVALLVLLLLIAEALIMESRNPLLKRLKLFKPRKR